MFISPEIISWALLGAASVCAFMIGREWNARRFDQISQMTIEFMYEEGYVKGKRLPDGDLEIFKLNEEE